MTIEKALAPKDLRATEAYPSAPESRMFSSYEAASRPARERREQQPGTFEKSYTKEVQELEDRLAQRSANTTTDYIKKRNSSTSLKC